MRRMSSSHRDIVSDGTRRALIKQWTTTRFQIFYLNISKSNSNYIVRCSLSLFYRWTCVIMPIFGTHAFICDRRSTRYCPLHGSGYLTYSLYSVGCVSFSSSFFSLVADNSSRAIAANRLAPSAVNFIVEWYIVCIRNKHALRAHLFAESATALGKEGPISISLNWKIKSKNRWHNIQI